MKKVLSAFLLFLFSLLSVAASYAQLVKDESKWTLEAKKKNGNQYELILHLQLPAKWHIYAFKPGGDGMEIPPTVEFVKNDKVKPEGTVKEKGKLQKEKMEGIDGIVSMYMGKVDYVQKATISGNTKLTCKYSYQICNDKMCLPPKDATISVDVKDAGSDAATPAISISPGAVTGQMVKDNSKWRFEAKRKSGDQYDLILHVKIPEQWHIYTFKPGGDGMQTPTTVKFIGDDKVKLEGAIKDIGKQLHETIVGTEGIVNTYVGDVDFIQQATISGNTKIKCRYHYQICNDNLCLSAVDGTLSVDVKDGGSAETTEVTAAQGNDTNKSDISSENAGADTSKKVATTISTEPSEDVTEKKPEEQSLILLFLLCFGGGLLAVVTPCVFSMIPITVSFFTKRSKTRKEGIRNAIYYSLSIIIIFTVLGLVISGIFGRDALYKISTNWILNIVFFLLFVVFGISFLGAFEITLPSSWTSKTDSKAGLGSFGGIFFMALTLVIVSFSCTGPILTMLFGLLAAGGYLGPIVGMFAFSLALSLPFALCAIFPAVINNLGKSGGWLNQVKVTLGFIELALALKFFSNADLLKHWRILDREIFLALWIVIAVILGFYLLGKLKLSHDDESKKNIYGQEYVSIFKLFLAICSFTFALYLLPGMWGAPLNGLGQFVPPMGTQDFVITGGEKNVSKAEEDVRPKKFVSEMKIYEPNVVRNNGLVSYFDYEEGIAASRMLKKPIMLDFTGITCVNCRRMETSVWSDPEVLKRLKNDFILISLFDDARQVSLPKEDIYFSKTENKDITTLGDKCLDIQIVKYNSNAQPFYFFIDEKEKKLVEEGYGYDPDVQKFIAHLDKVKENYKKSHP